MKSVLRRSIWPIQEEFRNQKIAVFLELANDWSPLGRLLDVGGGPGINGEFLSLCSRFTDMVMVNIERQDPVQFDGVHVRERVADGRDLSFESGPFDSVFSSAVIEHVGRYEDQVPFAIEILRIAAKAHSVACSNKHLPLEPHTLLPFYLPKSMQRKVAPHFPKCIGKLEEINPLRAAELQSLFPEAGVCTLGLPLPGINTAVYYRRKNGMA